MLCSPKFANLYSISFAEEGSEHRYFDQPQNLENPQRCPVKLYELYLSKW